MRSSARNVISVIRICERKSAGLHQTGSIITAFPNVRCMVCMKSKIRIRRSEDDKIYVVKTSKFITSEESDQLVEKRETAKEHHKKSK